MVGGTVNKDTHRYIIQRMSNFVEMLCDWTWCMDDDERHWMEYTMFFEVQVPGVNEQACTVALSPCHVPGVGRTHNLRLIGQDRDPVPVVGSLLASQGMTNCSGHAKWPLVDGELPDFQRTLAFIGEIEH
ncbi:hypothetical protein CAPTEDRAFT_214535 [Capitella teleta]|uniref:Uncharacterized protein n=1 Tax=Capitella teleta TaxID=283909 RepID=R7UJV4_CAPTE|nr:hypothetical protein CAPTEDRAFT_214535 [Capitella teleta]|eukprot:ELU06834.1 hypothetical protein CAPTEDRAFT_214535 [Capitella teleta]